MLPSTLSVVLLLCDPEGHSLALPAFDPGLDWFVSAVKRSCWVHCSEFLGMMRKVRGSCVWEAGSGKVIFFAQYSEPYHPNSRIQRNPDLGLKGESQILTQKVKTGRPKDTIAAS